MSQPPNILLILADQLMPFLTGAYGHPVVKTPHLDRLAGSGAASGRRRELIRQAMARNDTHWDYFPFFDATKQYVR